MVIKNLDVHKQENVLYHICGVLCRFTIEGNVDRYNVNTSKSGLVHEGDRWFNDAWKIIIVYFEDHTNTSIRQCAKLQYLLVLQHLLHIVTLGL